MIKRVKLPVSLLSIFLSSCASTMYEGTLNNNPECATQNGADFRKVNQCIEMYPPKSQELSSCVRNTAGLDGQQLSQYQMQSMSDCVSRAFKNSMH